MHKDIKYIGIQDCQKFYLIVNDSHSLELVV